MVLSQSPNAVIFPPSDLESNEPPLESDRHLQQIILLLTCLQWWWRERPDAPESRRNNFYAAGNMTVYYSSRQLRNEQFRGPDFFVVLDTEYKERKSWVVWDEDGKYPNVIVEMLSDSTADIDRTQKKQIYQNTFRTPEYFWFDPYTLEFKGFRFVGAYEEIATTQEGWLWSQELDLYLGIVDDKLRFLTPEGELVPTPSEAAQQQQQQTEVERERAEAERERAEAERERAEAAEAELERLRQQIQERGINLDM
ncbi:MAG: Uma2 family endonuclease [Cyanobacteriota bacterium]|nr:Uma2 family endonuclease [Cyanobacteriota bacterium]